MSDHSNDSVDDRQQPDDLPVSTGDAEVMPTLDELAAIANQKGALVESAIDDARAAFSVGLTHAIAAGAALTQAKMMVARGGWRDWVARHINYNRSTVERFVRLYHYRDFLSEYGHTSSVKKALSALAGMKCAPSPHLGKVGSGIKFTAKKMRSEGATYKDIAEVCGVSWATAKALVDPEYHQQINARARAKQQRSRDATKALARQERDAAVAATGGEPAAAYASLRKAVAAIDKALDASTDSEEREALQAAMSAMHKAEDAIVRALRIGRRAAA